MATSPRPIVPDPVAARPVQLDQVEHLLKLQKWAQKITSILDLDELIHKIVDDVATSFCCVETNIYLHDQERGELEMAGVHGCTVHGKGSRLKVGTEGMVGYVAATRQMRYAPDVRQDPYYIACEESTLSEVAIPLLVDGQLVGVFAASHHDLDAFTREHLRWLQSLCDHVAVAVHNARRFQHERHERQRMSHEEHEARAIQQALLPKSSPFIPGFAISGLSIPAGAVGGDWYDFISFDDGCWGLVLADVSGKGTAAALLMSATRGMLRSLTQTCSGPGEVLTRLNRLLVEDFPSGKFVTMLLAVLNPTDAGVDVFQRGPPAAAAGGRTRRAFPGQRTRHAAGARHRGILREPGATLARLKTGFLQRRNYGSHRPVRRRVRRGAHAGPCVAAGSLRGEHPGGRASLRQRAGLAG